MGSTQGAFKKGIIILELVSHMEFTDKELVYLNVWGIKKKQSKDLISNWLIIKIP